MRCGIDISVVQQLHDPLYVTRAIYNHASYECVGVAKKRTEDMNTWQSSDGIIEAMSWLILSWRISR